LEVPNFVTVAVRVDLSPNTIYVGNDGIVRYVAGHDQFDGTTMRVRKASGAVTGEVKTYARVGLQWNLVTGSQPGMA